MHLVRQPFPRSGTDGCPRQPVSTRARVSVVHLVYEPYGIAVFEKFIQSYASIPSGLAHRLIVLLKGFATEGETMEYRRRLDGYPCTCYRVANRGFDIGSYMDAARAHPSDYYCFFNSRSRLLSDNWLEKLYSNLLVGGVGVVSATGSYESKYTDYLRSLRDAQSPACEPKRPSFFREVERFWNYPPFPNWHVRTNAFMLAADTLGQLQSPPIRRRRDAAKFENGRLGMTRQLMSMGLDAVVVGKNGRGYKPEEWPSSNTYWQGEQENLLVADNQTERYANAGLEERRGLLAMAWTSDDSDLGASPSGVARILGSFVRTVRKVKPRKVNSLRVT